MRLAPRAADVPTDHRMPDMWGRARVRLRHPRSVRPVRDRRREGGEGTDGDSVAAARAFHHSMSRPHGALAWAELAAALLITALIVFLNVRFSTHAGPLWRDEVSTLRLAPPPTYAQVARSLSFDSAPLLFPTLVRLDRKSTRLNSSHSQISYAVFCLKKKKKTRCEFNSHPISCAYLCSACCAHSSSRTVWST